MKVEISEDQNTLIANGVEYEAKTGGHVCDDCSFWHINSFAGCSIGGMAFSKCAPKNRADGKSIHWIKKEIEQMTEAPAPAPAPAPHRHFDLIVAWAKNPTQQVWAWSSIRAQWVCVRGHEWLNDFYAIGEKPTAPPTKKLKVKIELDRNEFEIEVPYDARPQEVDKAILDMATQFMVVTQEPI